MAIRKVIQAGHPGLKTKNKIVKDINSSVTKKIIKDMKSTMYKVGLIGIAANQINENLMIFITHPRITKARKLGKKDRLRIFINPKFIFKSKNENIIYEGCGSVGDIFGPVSVLAKLKLRHLMKMGKSFH